MATLDLPSGGTVATGDAASIFGLVFGRPPRTNHDERRALSDLRRARQAHTLFIATARLLPWCADVYRVKRETERVLASEAVARVHAARIVLRRAGQ